ncbi:venom protease-like isoform X2 [Uloborus diversus]|uniref:venom protease-like isoform X2 n=1 Tax=Uloborus diversus TaxID=327109 RepID=UPI00240A5355|nr:venom protease-like isoform X2 [Uloborus diversus]
MLRLMFIYVIAFVLVTDAVSQVINFPTNADSSQSSMMCDDGASCVRPKRCREVLRQFGREVFCGRGGEKMVCCVSVRRRFNDTNVPRAPSSPTPDPLPPVSVSPSPKEFPVCGVSQPLPQGSENSLPTTAYDTGTKQGQFPWMVAVLFKSHGVYSVFCNGFMINHRQALSAAHCFEQPTRPDLYSIRIGDIYYAAGKKFKIADITLHEGYKPGAMYDDIAVLTLDKDVDFPGFSPICLPTEAAGYLEDTTFTSASWGATVPGGIMSPVLLHLNYIPIVPNDVCNEVISRGLNGFPAYLPKGVTDEIRCAAYSDEVGSTCHGDSGSPLMRQNANRWIAEGVLSFGFDRIQKYPKGYTLISNYLDWIRQKTQPGVELH